MNSTKAESLTKCLFRFSSRGNFPITVTTRSRGMVKRGQSLCYNSQTVGMQDFVSLSEEKSGSTSYYDMDTMFVLSENRMDPSSGVTCFGQDVAAYHEIVTIMVRTLNILIVCQDNEDYILLWLSNKNGIIMYFAIICIAKCGLSIV